MTTMPVRDPKAEKARRLALRAQALRYIRQQLAARQAGGGAQGWQPAPGPVSPVAVPKPFPRGQVLPAPEPQRGIADEQAALERFQARPYLPPPMEPRGYAQGPLAAPTPFRGPGPFPSRGFAQQAGEVMLATPGLRETFAAATRGMQGGLRPVQVGAELLGSVISPVRPEESGLGPLPTGATFRERLGRLIAQQELRSPEEQAILSLPFAGIPAPGAVTSPALAMAQAKMAVPTVRRGLAQALVRAKPTERLGLKVAGVEPVAGAARVPRDLSTVKGLDAEIADLERAGAVGKRNFADTSSIQTEIQNLRQLRERTLEAALGDAAYEQLQAARLRLMEATAELEAQKASGIIRPAWATGKTDQEVMALARHERLNPFQPDWYDSIDSAVVREFRQGKMKLPNVRTTSQLQNEVASLRREVAALERGVTAEAPQAQTIGVAQAGMGIGEKPAQGGLLENFPGEAQRAPLASPETLQARLSRQRQLAQGQGELPAGGVPPVPEARAPAPAAAPPPAAGELPPGYRDAALALQKDGSRIRFPDGQEVIVEGRQQMGLAYLYDLRDVKTGQLIRLTLRDVGNKFGYIPEIAPDLAAKAPVAAAPGEMPVTPTGARGAGALTTTEGEADAAARAGQPVTLWRGEPVGERPVSGGAVPFALDRAIAEGWAGPDGRVVAVSVPNDVLASLSADRIPGRGLTYRVPQELYTQAKTIRGPVPTEAPVRPAAVEMPVTPTGARGAQEITIRQALAGKRSMSFADLVDNEGHRFRLTLVPDTSATGTYGVRVQLPEGTQSFRMQYKGGGSLADAQKAFQEYINIDAPKGIRYTVEALPERAATKQPIPRTFDQETRAKLKELQAKRLKSHGDEITIERLQKTLIADSAKWQVGQGVGWRVVPGQVNRGYRIERVLPETKEAIIRPVGDIGQLADYTGQAERVDIIDLLRDKKYDLPLPRAPAAAAPVTKKPYIINPEARVTGTTPTGEPLEGIVLSVNHQTGAVLVKTEKGAVKTWETRLKPAPPTGARGAGAAWVTQSLGKLEKGDIIQFRPDGASYEVVGRSGRQVVVRDVQGATQTISADTPVMRTAGSWREAQDLAIRRYAPAELPPVRLGVEPAAATVKPEIPPVRPAAVVEPSPAPTEAAAVTTERPQVPAGKAEPIAPVTKEPIGPPAAPPPAPPAAGGAALPPPSPGAGIMGKLSDISEAIEVSQRPDIWRAVANAPGLRTVFGAMNPAAVAQSPAHQAIVGRAILRDQGRQLAEVAMSRLNAIGTQKQTFGALTEDGLMAAGPLKGLTVNTVRTNPGQYASKMTPAMKEWVKAADDIERAKLAFLRENGIEVAELAFEEGGQYAGRRVFAKVTQQGEFLEAGYVGAGPGRPGAKLAAEKHRIFKTAEEAIEQGYRYIPDDEALFFNVQGAYNRVADKQMADWLLLQVPWRTTAAPEALKLAAYQAHQKLLRSRQLLAALNRAVRGERLPPSTIASIRAAYPEQAEGLAGLVGKLQGPQPETAQAVLQMRTEAKQLIAEAQLDYAKAVSARATARERARATTFEEARIPAPAFAGKIFTGPEARETARVLRESMEPSFNRALGAVNQVNAVARYFMLAGDVSPMTIQLLYLAGANPKAYAGAAKGFVRALLDTRFQANYLAKPENMAIVQKYPGLILTRGGATEFTEAMARGGLLRKGPLGLIGKVLEPFQRGFEGALDVAGIEWAKALDHMGTTAARRADLEQFINEFRGVTSSARLGVSVGMRQAETAALLAPRYNRAIAALLFDTIHGGLRGDLARRSLAQGVAALAATSVAISWARGETPEEILAHLIPGTPTFVTWKVAGQNVGPGSKLRSVLQLFAMSAKDPSKLLDTSVGWGELEYMRNPLIKFGRGLASPVVSLGWDLLTGKGFIGDPTRDGLLSFTRTVAEAFMPVWTQTVAFEGGTLGERATRGAAEFFGGRAYPRNLIWELRTEWAKGFKVYEKLPTTAAEARAKKVLTRQEYRKRNPEIDARLFITGQVQSPQTEQAKAIAVQLMQENRLKITDIRGLEKKEFESEEQTALRRFFEAQLGQGAAPARPTPSVPQPTPARRSKEELDRAIWEEARKRRELQPVK